MKKEKPSQPLAVVGIACRFPKADDLAAYWKNLKGGVDAITEVPATHWRSEDYFNADPKSPDKTYGRRGGFLSPLQFNPMEFGMAPKDIEATDTSQILAMVAAQDALKDAGYDKRTFDRDRTSVILGVTGTLELVIPLGARLGHPLWRKAMLEAGIDAAAVDDAVERISDGYVGWQENSFPGLLGNVVAGRIANRLDLGGTNCVVDAACASSLSALNLAGLELESGRSDMVVTGGVDTFNDIFMFMCFSKTPALSPTGNSKPFDASGDGTILGEGLGMLVIKRLEDAEKDGDRIYAVIKGVGSSSDGKGTAIYEPSAGGQSRALKNAYRISGVTPDSVELVEAHGTGTKVGDATEVSALTEVYREYRREGSWCALGSVKSMIGHTKAAAGSAGLIKTVLALKHKILPPTIKVTTPNKSVAPGTTPFYVNTLKRPWLPREEHPRRAALSALGFGGSNFHCVVEEYGAKKAAPDWDGEAQILAFHAKDAAALDDALSAFPAGGDWAEIREEAARTRAAFDPEGGCRLLAVVERGADIGALLAQARKLLKKNEGAAFWSAPNGLYFGSGGAAGKLGVLFPGQGSQYTGMLRDVVCQFPRALETLAEANAAYPGKGEERLSDIVYPHPTFNDGDKDRDEETLRATKTAQPAIGAISLGALRVLEDFGIRPEAAAGHSYGELTALCAAGRFDADTLFRLSELRGRLMAEGEGDRGSMLAVQAPIEKVEKAVAEGGFDLVLANKNAPSQAVLSGATQEIERAEKHLSEKGLRCKRLPVAAAFHSKLVAQARVPFEKALKDVPFVKAAFPVFANTTAEAYPDAPAKSRSLLAAQLANPVEFVREIENLYAAGVRTFLEVGPGARLTGLVKAILEGQPFDAVAVDASSGKRSGIADLARALACAASRGHAVALGKWDEGFEPAEKADAKKPAFTVPLSGANYRAPRKPKPPRPAAPKPARPALPPAPLPSADPQASHSRTQEHLEALQRIQEQTALLHAKFLEGQETALHTIQALIAGEQGVVPAVPAAPAPAPAGVSSDKAEKVLLEIVAEKTGYPAEMLNLDMGLDSDLGIDSIKRVEILSALQEKLPEAPAVKPDQLGTLRTLRQVVEFLGAGIPAGASGGGPAPSQVPAASDGISPDKVEKVLLEIVAEKTGYPAEMLNLDMGLDSDLGIDSIKRVEILSALQEKLPEAPAVKPDQLGALRTLRQVVEFLSANGSASVPAAVPAKKGAVPPERARKVPAPDRPLIRRVIETVEPEKNRKAVALGRNAEIWVTDDESGLSASTAKALAARGFKTRVLSYDEWPGVKPPKELGGLVILAPALGAVDRAITRGSAASTRRWEAADAYVKDALFLLKKAAPALRAAGKSGGAVFAAVTRFDGAFGLKKIAEDAEPSANALSGLAKTAGREWPEVACKAIDVDPEMKAPAEDIVDELLLVGPSEVGISEGERTALRVERSKLSPGKHIPLSPDDVVLVTGGARGVTAEAAVALAKAFKPTLVLLGRSAAPTPEPDWLAGLEGEAEIKKILLSRAKAALTPKELEERYRDLAGNREMLRNIARMERSGATVFYRSVNVRDAGAVRTLVEELEANEGPVRGIVHGAGVLADRRIEDKTQEQFDRVYGTKVEGLRALWDAIDAKTLNILVLFSSTTARLGRAGQVDYAMANETLNAFARREARRLPGCRVLSVNWGPWEGGMVTPSLQKVFENEGVGLIPLAKGAEYLIEELRAGSGPTETVILGGGAEEGPVVPLKPTEGRLSQVFERVLDLENHPFLSSHVMDGKAVLPMAMIVEWFAHGALHGQPGLVFCGFEELRILKGVRLGSGEASKVRVLAGKPERKDGLYFVPVEMRSEVSGTEAVHARGTIVLGDRTPKPDAPMVDVNPRKFPGPTSRVYDDYLFHGKDLRCIRKIEGCSPEGIVSAVDTAPSPSRWIKKPLRSRWLADPLALDGAFQLMIVWSFEKHGAGALPCYAASYRQFRTAFPKEGVRIVIRVIKNGRHRALADIEFLDSQGELVARIEGYECVVDESLNEAFKRRSIVSEVAG